MADDHAVRQRIQRKCLARIGKQFHRRVIGTPYRLQSALSVRTGECGPSRIFDTGRFAHLHPDMGVVGTAAPVPAPVIPGQRLVYLSRVAVYKSMNAGPGRLRAVPLAHKHLRRGLGTSHAVQHQPLYRDLPPAFKAGVVR